MTKVTAERLWIEPLDCCRLLLHAMQALAGESCIIIEGEFEPSCFKGIENLIRLELDSRISREARDSNAVIVFSLTPEVVLPLWRNVFQEVDLKNKFAAIQIVRNGAVQFMSGDYFDPECVSVGSDISLPLLEDWVRVGLTSGPLRRRSFD